MSHKNLEMLCLTWNVNEQRPDGSPLFKWIADLSARASVAVIALQEIEMGGGSVAVAAAKDILNKSAQVSSPILLCLCKSHQAGEHSFSRQNRFPCVGYVRSKPLGMNRCMQAHRCFPVLFLLLKSQRDGATHKPVLNSYMC